MKKIILSATMLTVLVLASCGKSAVCDCSDTLLSMMKESKESKMDPAKMTAIQEKYKGDLEKCEKITEGKTEAEIKAMDAEMKECDSFKEMEKMSKEMMGQ